MVGQIKVRTGQVIAARPLEVEGEGEEIYLTTSFGKFGVRDGEGGNSLSVKIEEEGKIIIFLYDLDVPEYFCWYPGESVLKEWPKQPKKEPENKNSEVKEK